MSSSSKGYYAKVKGTFWRHDRTSSLSLAARGLWVSLLSWSSDQASDGAVSARGLEMAAGLRADKESVRSHAKALEELLAAELLVRVGNGFQLRDWDQHNITREKYEAQKEAVQKRVNKSREKTKVTPGEARDEAATQTPVTPPVTRYSDATGRVTKPLPSDQDQDQDQDQDFLEKTENARVADGAHDALRRTRSALVEVWAAFGKSHDASFANDAVMRRLADAVPDVEALKSAATAYLKDEGEYVVKAGHPLALFSKQWSRYVETRGPSVRPNSTYQNRTMTGAELFATGAR